MSNVVSLFPKTTAGTGATNANKPAIPRPIKAKSRRSQNVELTAEAAKFVNAIKALSTIQGTKSDLYQHLTYRSEVELTKNFEKAVELLQRFAKELKPHVSEQNNSIAELA